MGLSRAGQLQLLQHQVATAALSGVGLDEIERDVIDPSNCSAEHKEALRLYAFSFLSRFDQRRITFDRLHAASTLRTDRPRARRPSGNQHGHSHGRVMPGAYTGEVECNEQGSKK